MITLATAQITSPAPPDAFFARWADTDTWSEWNADTEWVKLRGPFVQGARGELKPKGAPRVGFEVTALVPGKEFTDVSKLLGARLTFRHLVSDAPDGATRVDVTVTMRGPLARLWAKALGKGIAQSLQGDLDRLATAAETPRVSPAAGPEEGGGSDADAGPGPDADAGPGAGPDEGPDEGPAGTPRDS